MKYAPAALLVLALVLGTIWYFFGTNEPAPADEQVETLPDSAAGGSIAPAIAWYFNDAGEVNGMPQTKVEVFIDGETYDLGTSQGSCSELSAEELQENQVSGALCWYAGAGDEYGVFIENERYVVRKGVKEEPTAETAGFRGSFETLFSL